MPVAVRRLERCRQAMTIAWRNPTTDGALIDAARGRSFRGNADSAVEVSLLDAVKCTSGWTRRFQSAIVKV